MISKLIEIAKKNRKVKAIILFGSYVKKKATPISDIDICIIGDKISDKEKAEIESFSNEKLQISFFDELPIAIRFRVFKEGKIIFLRDEKFLNSLKAETISRFLDFKPLLERYFNKVYGWKYEI